MMFPADIDKYRLALTLIIAHQRLNRTEIPVNAELSAFHKQIRSTAERVITVNNDQKRRYYFARLLQELDQYQQKLVDYQAADAVIRPVKRLTEMLRKYQSALI